MLASRVASSPTSASGSTRRRDAVRSLGALGVGLLAALGVREATARAKKRGKGGKRKVGPPGPPGPPGPTFSSVVIEGTPSSALQAFKGDQVEALALCSGAGKL